MDDVTSATSAASDALILEICTLAVFPLVLVVAHILRGGNIPDTSEELA
jgi:hypothetical protein